VECPRKGRSVSDVTHECLNELQLAYKGTGVAELRSAGLPWGLAVRAAGHSTPWHGMRACNSVACTWGVQVECVHAMALPVLGLCELSVCNVVACTWAVRVECVYTMVLPALGLCELRACNGVACTWAVRVACKGNSPPRAMSQTNKACAIAAAALQWALVRQHLRRPQVRQ